MCAIATYIFASCFLVIFMAVVSLKFAIMFLSSLPITSYMVASYFSPFFVFSLEVITKNYSVKSAVSGLRSQQ